MALKLKGSTSGFVAVDCAAEGGNNTLILPSSNGVAGAIWANNVDTAGVATCTSITINKNGDLTVPGTVSVGGTITYEDVTNVDSVGIITARSGVYFGATGSGTLVQGDASGIGIGTADPTYKFHVETSGSAALGRFKRSDAGAALFQIMSQDGGNVVLSLGDGTDPDIQYIKSDNSDNSLSFGSNTAERLRITSTGEVGIGLTNPESFHANANQLVIQDSGSCGLTIDATSSSNCSIFFADGADGNEAYRGWVQYENSNDALTFGSAATERVRITSTGSVGIGTNNPDVGNTAYPVVQVHGTSTNAYFKLTNTTTGVGSGDGVELSLSGSDAYLTNRESANIIFRTGGSNERLRIDSSGRVLIGTTTEGAATADDLTVATSGDTGITVRSGTSSSGNLFFSDGTSGNSEIRGYVQYLHSSNALLFGTNASERLRILSSGNISVGRTDAISKIGVTGTGDASTGATNLGTTAAAAGLFLKTHSGSSAGLALGGRDTGGQYIQAEYEASTVVSVRDLSINPYGGGVAIGVLATAFGGNPGADTILLGTSQTERMRITSAGLVGIGIASPDSLLHLEGSGSDAKIKLQRTGTTIGGSINTRDESGDKGLTYIAKDGNSGVPNHVFQTDAGSGAVERLRITSGGQVGINTTTIVSGNNYATLHVGGTNNAGGQAGQANVLIGNTFSSGNKLPKNCQLTLAGSHNSTGYNDDGQVKLYITGSNNDGSVVNYPIYCEDENANVQFVVRQNGGDIGVGIGMGDPAYRLDVTSGGGAVVGRFRQTTNTTADTGACLLLRHAGALSGQNGVGVLFQNSGGSKAGNINIGNSTVGYESGSDYRLKENEVLISDGITRLKTLKPYKFNFKNEPPSITTEGFFAHEAQEVVPYAVSGEKDGEDMQSMDYGRLTPLLTAALQEAIAKIETLEAEVAALKSA